MEVLFVISIAFIAYTYAIYPLVITGWGLLAPRRVRKRYKHVPVSVVLAVRNEEDNIFARLENLLGQEYPPEMLDIVVVSDGSTDRTVELAERIQDERIQVLRAANPVGKAEAINMGVAAAKNDIIIFADARQRFTESAIAELTAMFHDPDVGAVSGELVIRKGSASEVREGVGFYWQYEKHIRRMESAADSVVGATGSIYAIRGKLFRPLEPNTLLDDFIVPMRIVLQGFRVIFVRSAKAYDWTSASSGHEFARKVRTLAGNFQAMSLERSLLDPRKNRVFFQMVSHKLTRLVAPYFFVTAFVTNLLLHGDLFRVTLTAQLLFYSMILLRFTPLVNTRGGGIIRVPWTFAVLNAAAVMGLWVFLTGRHGAVWKKSDGQGQANDSRNRSVRSTP